MLSPIRTARLTGAAYLGLAVTGVLGYLILRPQLRNSDDPAATVANILEHSTLAHLSLGLELLVVITQALAALGFYALFRKERPVAAFGVASFGMANALAILASAAMLATAVTVAGSPALTPGGDAAGTVALLHTISDALWAAGGVFFGLWLIPMGWFMISTQRMPHVLGIFLVVGGFGYLLSAVLPAAIDGVPSAVTDSLVIPATVGELWTIGYLLTRGIRPAQQAEATLATATTAATPR